MTGYAHFSHTPTTLSRPEKSFHINVNTECRGDVSLFDHITCVVIDLQRSKTTEI